MTYDANGVEIAVRAATNAINNCCLTPYEAANAARKVLERFEGAKSDHDKVVSDLIDMLREE